MVGGENMDGPKRDYVLKLMDKKNKYENELRHQHEILKINNIGMHEPLVDAQGYPRNDIDVYQVRHARHKIITLENDLRHIMRLIEKGVADAHADFIGTPASRRSEAGSKVPADGHADSGPRKPFAVVTRVDHGSPADSCGLCADDKIILSSFFFFFFGFLCFEPHKFCQCPRQCYFHKFSGFINFRNNMAGLFTTITNN